MAHLGNPWKPLQSKRHIGFWLVGYVYHTTATPTTKKETNETPVTSITLDVVHITRETEGIAGCLSDAIYGIKHVLNM
jgi:hypothetical protein